MFRNHVLAARLGATGTVLVLMLAFGVQFIITPAALASIGQDPLARTIPVALPDGTEFTILTTEEITSKTASEGDRLVFRVAEDVVVDGHVLIAKDALVKGEVAAVKKSGFFGRGGNVGIRIDSTITVDNQTTKLRSAKSKAGDDKNRDHRSPCRSLRTIGLLEKGKASDYQTGDCY